MHAAFEGVEFHALLPVVEPGYAALNAARLPEFAPALVATRIPPAPRIATAMTFKIRIGLAMPAPPQKARYWRRPQHQIASGAVTTSRDPGRGREVIFHLQ
jgi:hypothetical protein